MAVTPLLYGNQIQVVIALIVGFRVNSYTIVQGYSTGGLWSIHLVSVIIAGPQAPG